MPRAGAALQSSLPLGANLLPGSQGRHSFSHSLHDARSVWRRAGPKSGTQVGLPRVRWPLRCEQLLERTKLRKGASPALLFSHRRRATMFLWVERAASLSMVPGFSPTEVAARAQKRQIEYDALALRTAKPKILTVRLLNQRTTKARATTSHPNPAAPGSKAKKTGKCSCRPRATSPE